MNESQNTQPEEATGTDQASQPTTQLPNETAVLGDTVQVPEFAAQDAQPTVNYGAAEFASSASGQIPQVQAATQVPSAEPYAAPGFAPGAEQSSVGGSQYSAGGSPVAQYAAPQQYGAPYAGQQQGHYAQNPYTQQGSYDAGAYGAGTQYPAGAPYAGNASYAQGYTAPSAPAAPGDAFSITSFVIGIVSVFAGFTFFAPLAGLIFGILGRRRGTNHSALNMWGIVLNAVMLGFWALIVGLFFLLGTISYFASYSWYF